jgi:hypothetical protein
MKSALGFAVTLLIAVVVVGLAWVILVVVLAAAAAARATWNGPASSKSERDSGVVQEEGGTSDPA